MSHDELAQQLGRDREQWRTIYVGLANPRQDCSYRTSINTGRVVAQQGVGKIQLTR